MDLVGQSLYTIHTDEPSDVNELNGYIIQNTEQHTPSHHHPISAAHVGRLFVMGVCVVCIKSEFPLPLPHTWTLLCLFIPSENVSDWLP